MKLSLRVTIYMSYQLLLYVTFFRSPQFGNTRSAFSTFKTNLCLSPPLKQ